ncbi:M24 family metallopeptidase [Schlesneria sp. T3-172]|uniref:M24 family metallopeptidase n=1 Tax=Schlesneria sphaerica TaxID=3373610 RepID=UPI0037CB37C7
MTNDRHSSRRQKLIQAIRKGGIAGLLVSNSKNVSYLTGFTGEDSYLLIGPTNVQIFSDSRFETQLQMECPGVPAMIRNSKTTMIEFLAQELVKHKLPNLGIEATSMTVDVRDNLADKLGSVTLVAKTGLVEELRQIKDAGEIEELRLAVDQAERGFSIMKSMLMPTMTERQAAHDLEHGMRRFGALKAAFEPIIAVGDHAALPHYRAGLRRFEESTFVLCDWGAVSPQGYHSDLTRVWSTGKVPPKLLRIYGVVLNAQQAAIAAIRPGVKCQDVDRVARAVIEEAGYAKYFGHGLGHGIGLDIHEGPRLSPISSEVLKPGMVVTVEPGIYLPGIGGVRIEDDVVVTRDGYEVITSVSRELGG